METVNFSVTKIWACQLIRFCGPFAIFFLAFLQVGVAQKTTVSGKVTDALTDEPVPFVNVVFSGTSVGATTNFDGWFSISTTEKYDSVTVSYIGYIPVKKKINPGISQNINFQLHESVVNLQEIVVRPGNRENPAYAILREVVKNKKHNDKHSLTAYQYETYSKTEIDVSNLPDRLRKQKLMKSIEAVLDSIGEVTAEDGTAVLPVFISETLGEFYFRDKPELQKERILKTRIKGIGVEDGSLVSQLLGSSLQDYNFYDNRLNFLDKTLISPVADSWKLYYDYDLTDSLYLGKDYCYRLEVFPKREQELAFHGTIWITKKEYALKQLDVSIRETANINYIDRIYIQQQLMKTEAGPWIPEKSRVVVSAKPAGPKSPGLLLKFYTSVKNPVVNNPYETAFYHQNLEVLQDSQETSNEYWNENRHDSLSDDELLVMQMIDTVRNIPSVKRTVKIVRAVGSGYLSIGKIDIGPYPLFYTYNNIEGHRAGIGLSTNDYFSKKVNLWAFAAYGERDNRLKYNLLATWLMSRKTWTVASIGTAKEAEQVGLDPDELRQNSFFYALTKWGTLRNPYLYTNSYFNLQTDLWKGVTVKSGIETREFQPLYPFAFNPDPGPEDSKLYRNFTVAEVSTELRLVKKESFIVSNNNRNSLRNSPWPDLTLKYTYGFKDFLSSDFEYHKLKIKSTHRMNVAFLGTSGYQFEAGKIFNPLPYPLLKIFTGNESYFYTSAAYNLMNYLEFVSDSYVSMRLTHNFEGLILSRIPLVKKLKWRTVAQANMVYGSLSRENIRLLKDTEEASGSGEARLFSFSGKPYLEAGYGIENIFKVLRIDVFHRLTYRENIDAQNFGIKVSAQITL